MLLCTWYKCHYYSHGTFLTSVLSYMYVLYVSQGSQTTSFGWEINPSRIFFMLFVILIVSVVVCKNDIHKVDAFVSMLFQFSSWTLLVCAFKAVWLHSTTGHHFLTRASVPHDAILVWVQSLCLSLLTTWDPHDRIAGIVSLKYRGKSVFKVEMMEV